MFVKLFKEVTEFHISESEDPFFFLYKTLYLDKIFVLKLPLMYRCS